MPFLTDGTALHSKHTGNTLRPLVETRRIFMWSMRIFGEVPGECYRRTLDPELSCRYRRVRPRLHHPPSALVHEGREFEVSPDARYHLTHGASVSSDTAYHRDGLCALITEPAASPKSTPGKRWASNAANVERTIT